MFENDLRKSILYRCGKCSNCKEFDTQRAAYAAAISENRDDSVVKENLEASWNALKKSLTCEKK